MGHPTIHKARSVFRLVAALCSALILGAYAAAQLVNSGSTHHASRGDGANANSRAVRSAGSDTLLSLTGDGWHTWTVDAVEGAPDWCCYTWHGTDGVTRQACNLDGKSYGVSTSSEEATTTQFKIYAELEQGRTTSIRAYGASCSVVGEKPVRDHGKVVAGASLDWLDQAFGQDKQLDGSALAAIAVHAGDRAQRLLVDAASDGQPVSTRKQSIFWMGQVRPRQSEGTLTDLMLGDDSDEVREHAVFSVSQSVIARKLSSISQVAREDRSTKVRSQAWFWLAQTDESRAGQLIIDGMKSETSEKVLKQAVFALSQLSGDEAVDRLIEVVEHPHYDRKVRQQALFWLAQDGSNRAVEYLADVLDR